MPVISGGGGNTTAQVTASGKVIPVADAVGATVDTTTYNNPITGSGKLTTIVLAAETAAFAIAQAGDAFPRWIFGSNQGDGISLWDGTADPYSSGRSLGLSGSGSSTAWGADRIILGAATPLTKFDAAALQMISPRLTITSGALPTVQLVSGTGAQISTSRDAETVTPCTFNPGAATTATVTVALSPDNVTYSTLAVVTEPAGVALDGTILPINVRVPAGWYIKLTVNAQAVLGLTTYY